MIYVKDSINVQCVELHINQANVLHIRLDAADKKWNLLAIYRSPSFNDITDFLSDLESILNELRGQQVICAGDMNINTLQIRPHHQLNDYCDLLSEHGLRLCIKQATRTTTETASCIDHIATNSRDNLFPIIYESTITDHFTTILGVQHISRNSANETGTHKINEKIDINSLKNELLNEEWIHVLEDNNPDTSYDTFLSTLRQHIQNNIKQHRRQKKYKPIKPWITRGIVAAIRTRNLLNKRRKEDPNNINLTNFYRRYRNTLTALIHETKDQYYREKLYEAGKDNKKMWKVIKDATDSKSKTKMKLNAIKIDDRIFNLKENPETVLNHMNNFFTNVGEEMAETIIDSLRKPLDQIISQYKPVTRTLHSIYFHPVTEDELLEAISSLRNDSAPGLDGINNRTLKSIKNVIVKPLIHIFNLSLSKGIFPKAMKETCVRPLHKGGDKTNATNYRPISLISNISKILEKLVKKRLVNYMEKNNLLSRNQFGFREGRSTEDAVLELSNFVTDKLENNKKCAAVFLDLAKAFDTVNHSLLLKKLEAMGIRGVPLAWFRSYLCDRRQKVKVEEHLSSEETMKFGIPQGTVLGPILYLAYANELCSIKIRGRVIAFADDT